MGRNLDSARQGDSIPTSNSSFGPGGRGDGEDLTNATCGSPPMYIPLSLSHQSINQSVMMGFLLSGPGQHRAVLWSSGGLPRRRRTCAGERTMHLSMRLLLLLLVLRRVLLHHSQGGVGRVLVDGPPSLSRILMTRRFDITSTCPRQACWPPAPGGGSIVVVLCLTAGGATE